LSCIDADEWKALMHVPADSTATLSAMAVAGFAGV